MKEEIKSSTPPDVIARELTKSEYNIVGYSFEPANLEDKGSTRGVALYVHKSLNFSKLDTREIISSNADAPKEVISIELKLAKNEKMIISNIYRNPSSEGKANVAINNFFRSTGRLNYEHQVIGDFNRKDINWNTVSSSSEDNCKFIEATRDSFLTSAYFNTYERKRHKRSISTGLILHLKRREH